VIRESRLFFDELPVERACALLSVSRSDYYQALSPTPPDPAASEEETLRSVIEALVLEWPSYGYRRITAQLQREGFLVNRKRVLRIMREEGWLWRGSRRWVQTTDSKHGLEVYPNLLKECGWRRLCAPNQAWVADLTYIRLEQEFCYLAAVLDAYSRRVVGWSLSTQLEAAFAVAALDQALSVRQPKAGWIHHSDRGVQYACREYVARVLSAGGQVSMAAKGTPRENAQAESFMRTLKQEAVYLDGYGTFAEAQRGIDRFIGAVYNEKRLHSALGYRSPSEFEELIAAGVLH
jgi:putative transposase